MTDDRDARLAALLRADAPDARDPLFRLGVIERRERMRFQRRTALFVAGAIVSLALAMFGAEAMSARTFDTAGVVFFGVVLTLVGLVFAPRLARLLSVLRN